MALDLSVGMAAIAGGLIAAISVSVAVTNSRVAVKASKLARSDASNARRKAGYGVMVCRKCGAEQVTRKASTELVTCESCGFTGYLQPIGVADVNAAEEGGQENEVEGVLVCRKCGEAQHDVSDTEWHHCNECGFTGHLQLA